MSQPPGVHVTVNGNVGNLGVGDHHQQQTGNGITAKMAHREGINFAALTPLLTALMAEIHNLPNGEVKPALVAKVQEIQTEAAKEKPNPSELGTAVEKVKTRLNCWVMAKKLRIFASRFPLILHLAYRSSLPYCHEHPHEQPFRRPQRKQRTRTRR